MKPKFNLTGVLSLFALLIMGFYLWVFYPGYMSFDSAYHYQQLENGEWTTFQPVIILLFWQLTDAIIKGPGGLFVLFLLLYLVALWLIARYLQGGWLRRMLVTLTALLPINIMLFPHIWKDIGLLVFVLLAIACLLAFLSTARKGFIIASVLAMWLAVLFRFEAILYLWPLVFFQVQTWRTGINIEYSLLRRPQYLLRDGFFVGLFVVIAVLGNKALVQASGAKKVTLWPTVALWDIARVSIREDKVLLPAFTVGVGMNVEDLHQATHDWTNTSLFSSTKAGVNNGLGVPYSQAQYRELLNVWVTLPLRYPISYAKHRLRLGSDLFRVVETPNKPQDLFWINQIVNYGERFPINQSQLNRLVNNLLVKHKDDIYFKPWFYLLLAIGIALYLWRFSWYALNVQQRLALHLLACAFLSAGVMLFLAPAAEQRYLIILFNVIPLAGLLAWQNRAGTAV